MRSSTFFQYVLSDNNTTIHMTKIYLVTNCYNDPNKVYVGKTKNSRKNPHTKTYGGNIEYTYIDQVNSLDRKYWKPLESYWIEQFRQWGFEVVNKQKRGGSGTEYQTEESKRKIGKNQKNKPKPHTDDWNKNIGKSLLGKTQSFSTIQKRRESNSKPIIQYDLQGNTIKEWLSAKEAAEVLNLGYTSINNCCNGYSKSSYGFIWKFKK